MRFYQLVLLVQFIGIFVHCIVRLPVCIGIDLLLKCAVACDTFPQSTDTVAFLYTNGKISVVKCIEGAEYRTKQDFKRLTKAFDTDFFFLATPNFMASFTMYESMSLIPNDELDDIERIQMAVGEDEIKKPQRAILHLKIPTPFEVIINEEIISLLNSFRSTKNVEE